jgi:hypothetical protein
MKLNTKDTMAKLPGLFQRNGVWTLRVMIPLELQPSYGSRSKIIESLQTGDYDQAKVRGTQRRAALLEEFQQKRHELNPLRVAAGHSGHGQDARGSGLSRRPWNG